MKHEELKMAVYTCHQFLTATNKVQEDKKESDVYICGGKDAAALRRASMDLTRQLAKLRSR